MEIIAVLIIIAAVIIIEQIIFSRLVLKNLTYTVRFSKNEAMEGDTIEIIEEIVNDKRLPVPWVKTELITSKWLEFAGTQTIKTSDMRFVPSVFSLRPHQKCTRTRKVVAMKRGNFRLESASIVGSDLLGIVSVSNALAIDEGIRILPAPHEVAVSGLSQEELFGELTTRRFICDDPFLISGAREYTGREPMNRIHWNSTARTGRMMAFNNDYTTQNRAAVIINMQKTDSRAEDPLMTGDIETFIKTAAFLLDTLSVSGASTDLYTNGSGVICRKGGSEQGEYLDLMRVLSDIDNTVDRSFDDFLDDIVHSEGLLSDRTDIIIITAYIDDYMKNFAADMRRSGKSVVFYCNDNTVDDSHLLRIGRISRFYN